MIFGGRGVQAARRRASSSSESRTESTPLGMSISMMSPSWSRPIGPPTAASGLTWPIDAPAVPPENRPSVIRAQLVVQADALDRRGGGEHLLHPGPSLGSFVADHHDVARLDLAEDDPVIGVDLALEDHRRPRVLEHLGADAGRLDHRPLGSQVAREHRQPAGLMNRRCRRCGSRRTGRNRRRWDRRRPNRLEPL